MLVALLVPVKCFFRSLCPAIYGHELVKAGLVLGLFGGAQKYSDSLVGSKLQLVERLGQYCVSLYPVQNNLPIRGDPHILVVGDPGLGKSQVSVFIEQ